MRANGPDTHANAVVELSLSYSLEVVRLFRELERDSVGRVLGNQLLRSGTSIGANVNEAQAAQSRADFISKLSIAHKEARESAYWLRLIVAAGVCSVETVTTLTDQTEQLIKLLSSIILSTKGVSRPNS